MFFAISGDENLEIKLARLGSLQRLQGRVLPTPSSFWGLHVCPWACGLLPPVSDCLVAWPWRVRTDGGNAARRLELGGDEQTSVKVNLQEMVNPCTLGSK